MSSPPNFRDSKTRPGPLFSNAKSNAADSKQIEELKRRQNEHSEAEKAQRELAKEKQAEGDALYWPIFNLDCKNPTAKQDFEHLPPEQLADEILQKELRVAEILREIKEILGRKP